MDVSTFSAYGAALAAVTLAPGPLIAVVLVRSLRRDIAGAVAFASGVCLGDMIAIGTIAAGLGAVFADNPSWLAVLRIGGILYLLWLAFQIWRDRHQRPSAAARGSGWIGAMGAGAALCLGNPATFLFYVLMLPSVLPSGPEMLGSLIAVMVLSLAVIGSVLAVMIVFALRIGDQVSAPGASAAISSVLASLIGAVAIWLLLA